ncbi:hypothetical protein LCGC14_0303550 [marine sediment metagenome]|uniref:Gene product 88 domain-containing protein n=1 Tax=marine sediment metagenome TaxID=412755 RepID=A0A0F9TUR6_9ZZZZ
MLIEKLEVLTTNRDYPVLYPAEFDCDCDPDFSYKVGKLKGIPVFNLPALDTCPHRTWLCEAACYAQKGHFTRPRARNLLKRNHQASKCDCFVRRMTYIIKNLLNYVILTKHMVIRWHSSGDFYSRKHFRKCVDLAELFPEITFFAYTRNYTLDLNLCPDNFIVFYSRDVTTKKINLTAKKHSFMMNHHKDKVKVPHLTKYKNGVICTSNRCDLCKYCWEGKGDVYFPQKYKTHEVKNPSIKDKI